MKTHLVKQGAYLSQIDNQRGSSVAVDLPVASGGTDQGPTAFELLAMSLNGCIATIFTTMAEKKRLNRGTDHRGRDGCDRLHPTDQDDRL